jgi:hypothetical protein
MLVGMARTKLREYPEQELLTGDGWVPNAEPQCARRHELDTGHMFRTIRLFSNPAKERPWAT